MYLNFFKNMKYLYKQSIIIGIKFFSYNFYLLKTYKERARKGRMKAGVSVLLSALRRIRKCFGRLLNIEDGREAIISTVGMGGSKI